MIFSFQIRKFVMLVTIVVTGCAGVDTMGENKTSEPSVYDIYEQRSATHASLGRYGPSAVLQRFILMRKGTAGCAVRFTSFRREGTNKPETWTSSGGYDTFAEYDWFFQGDGSFDFSKSNVQSGHGKLRWGPDSRLGHGIILSVPAGANRAVNCGSFSVYWSYPMNFSFVSFEGREQYFDKRIEYAPTKWKEIREVDFANPRLRWTGIENGLKQEVWIPLEDLP